MAFVQEAPVGTVEVAECCISWTVEEFSDLRGWYYVSPSFSLAAAGGGKKWRMEMWPYGQENIGHVTIGLRWLGVGAHTGRVLHQLSLYSLDYLTHHSQPTTADTFIYKIIKRVDLLKETGFLTNGQLKIHLKLWRVGTAEPICPHPNRQREQPVMADICSDNLHASTVKNLAEMSANDSRLTTDDRRMGERPLPADICSDNLMPPFAKNLATTDDQLSAVFKIWQQDRTYADMIVKVDDREFNIHKVVFASRSHVFDSMFRHEMSESNTGYVILTYITPEAFVALEEYMYTGRVVNLEKSAADLLKAAEKYELDGLKSMCETSLIKTISEQSVLEFLTLADLHSAPKLKKAALEFIKQHGLAVASSEAWASFLAEQPQLMAEVFSYLLLTKTK